MPFGILRIAKPLASISKYWGRKITWCKFGANKNQKNAKTKYFDSLNQMIKMAQCSSEQPRVPSKSELVNDLIRQARNQQVQIDWIRAKLDKAEQSGFTSVSKEDIRAEARELING